MEAVDKIINDLKKNNKAYSPTANLERNGNHVTPKNPDYLDPNWKSPCEVENNDEDNE